MSLYAIKCDCSTNPDIDGTYLVKDLEEDCRNLHMPESEWLPYLLGHLLEDYPDWYEELENAFALPQTKQLKLVLSGDSITLTKLYN